MGVGAVITRGDLAGLVLRPRMTSGWILERVREHLRPVGEGGTILQATIEPTFLCNLRCPMCSQWGTNGLGLRMMRGEVDAARIHDPVDLPTWRKVIDQLRPHRTAVSVTGGEPFAWPETTDLIEYASHAGLHVGIITNGTLLTAETIARLVRLPGLTDVVLSVDGNERDHDAIRGAGSWRKTLAAAEGLVRERAEIRRRAPLHIRGSITMQPGNLDHLGELVERARSLGMDAITATHLRWFTRERADLHVRTLREDFGYDDLGVYSEVCGPIPVGYGDRVFDAVRQLQERFGPFVQVESNFTRAQTLRYYSDVRWSFQSGCHQPSRAIRIRADGQVYFCPDQWIPGYLLGNVRTERLEGIWQGEKARAFRVALRQRGLWPGCAKCCIANRDGP